MGIIHKFLVAIGFVLSITSCRAIKEPEYKGIESFNLRGVKNDTSTFLLGLKYFNPNQSSLTMKEIMGNVYIDSVHLGYFFIDNVIEMPSNSEFIASVNLRIRIADVFTSALSVFAKKEFSLRLEGKCKVGKKGIFLPYPIRYEGKQSLPFF